MRLVLIDNTKKEHTTYSVYDNKRVISVYELQKPEYLDTSEVEVIRIADEEPSRA